MLYDDSITRNLPLFSPPGLQVALRRLGPKKVQFRIKAAGGSFLPSSNRPDIFTFEENEKLLKISSLMRIFDTSTDSSFRREVRP
jgi:hypothetical protein